MEVQAASILMMRPVTGRNKMVGHTDGRIEKGVPRELVVTEDVSSVLA